MKAARGLPDHVTVEPAYMLFALGASLIGVQTSNLQIEKVCKVGGYFLGNGTTYEDEVSLLLPFMSHVQVCDYLANGSFPDQQKAVQKVAANVDMYSDIMKQVLKFIINFTPISCEGSADGFCPVPRPMERQGGKKAPHPLTFLWQPHHLPWLPTQCLLL